MVNLLIPVTIYMNVKFFGRLLYILYTSIHLTLNPVSSYLSPSFSPSLSPSLSSINIKESKLLHYYYYIRGENIDLAGITAGVSLSVQHLSCWDFVSMGLVRGITGLLIVDHFLAQMILWVLGEQLESKLICCHQSLGKLSCKLL